MYCFMNARYSFIPRSSAHAASLGSLRKATVITPLEFSSPAGEWMRLVRLEVEVVRFHERLQGGRLLLLSGLQVEHVLKLAAAVLPLVPEGKPAVVHAPN